ncbi:MAG: protein kinase, partial [Planctomycetes bacterium]|nr:protein kinase [Planctomycetota bacterium]
LPGARSPMERIGPYRIDGELGRGGMGVVYRGFDEALGRPVAIKLMTHLPAPEDWERFRREARLTASVRHPHVVGVHGAGRTAEGQPYLVLELVEGGSLHDELKAHGALDPARAARVARDLADGLDAAHRRRVLHRDLKPHNVLLDADGRALLADFGLGRGVTAQGSVTQEGEILGTPAFMSPEQALAEHDRIGPATDVYGLGATLYAMLTGVPPHDGTTLIELLAAVVGATPAPVRERNPRVDPALEAICMRCLEHDPGRRFPSAAALRDALDDYRLGARGGAVGPSAERRADRDRAGVAGALGLVLGGLLGGVAVGLLRGPSAPPPTAPTSAGDAAQSLAPPPLAGDALTLRLRAAQRSGRGDHGGALEDLDALLARRPDLPELYAARAEERYAQSDYPGTLADLERAAPSLDPARLHFLRGQVHLQRDEHAAAEAEFSQALALRAHYPPALVQRGWAKEAAGDREGALADYAAALEQDPRYTDPRLRRAKLAFNRGEYSEARADAEAALEVAPELAVARELRARTLLELGEAGAALEATSALLREVLAARVEALLSQAQGLLFQESYQEAKVFCELALWAEPDSVDGYALRATTSRLLGEVAEQSGRPRDAAALYRAAVADHHAYLQRQPGLRAAERAGVEGEVRKLEERLAALGDR